MGAPFSLDVDLRQQFGPVSDQGPRETCLAFAVSGAHEHSRTTCMSTTLALSVEALYWKARQASGTTSGLSFRSVQAALADQGQPEEHLWPYDAKCDETSSGYGPPAGVLEPERCYKAHLKKLKSAIRPILSAINQQLAVVAGIRISTPFFEDSGGLIRMPTASEVLNEGHGLVFLGYSDSDKSADGYLLFRNSWGEEWGDHGYGYLPFAYYAQYGMGAFTVAPL